MNKNQNTTEAAAVTARPKFRPGIMEMADPKIACVSEKQEGFLMNAVYVEPQCECRVTGNGTLPFPLTVKQCARCAAAPDLLEFARRYLDSDATTTELDKMAKAAIAKAEGRQ